MKIVSKNLSELRMPAKNVRRHTEKQLAEYVRSVEMFGQIKPLVVDETGEIIAGNGLFMALQAMGREKCDCYVMSGLTPAQKKKLMLADNRVYELGITDTAVFQELVIELNGDIDIPGWDEDLLTVLNFEPPQVDDVVSAYGAFDREEIKHLESRPVEQGTTYETAQSAPASQPVSTEQVQPEQRHVICPKCGESIWL